MPTILHTKIQLPPLRGQHIARPRLLAQLCAPPADTRLTLVAAPAGFGKTSCLLEWAHAQRAAGMLVAWYALDARDNDPAAFSAYLRAACRDLHPTLAQLPPPTVGVEVQDAVHHLLNTAAGLELPLLLILDDYHLITAPAVHAAVHRLLDYMPPSLHLALGTRRDPPLPLARLRGQGALREVRPTDLRLSSAEVAHWLRLRLGWTPAPDLLDQVDALTEGWPTALALLLLRHPQADPPTLAEHLAAYAHAPRHLADYFMQEVLAQLPPDQQQFLLDTCVLDRLDPDVCAALTDRDDCGVLLDHLAAAGLFLLPLADHAPVYRYHHLFEQFLRQRLRSLDAPRYRHQQQRAAQWHADQDRLVEAVDHALAAADHDLAAHLIETRAWEALSSLGEIRTLLAWLPAFATATLRRHPRLCLYAARAHYLIGELTRAQQWVDMATDALDHAPPAQTDRAALLAIAANYQATFAAARGEIHAGLAWIARADPAHVPADGLDRVRIVNTQGYLAYLVGDVAAARRAYTDALTLAQRLGHHYLTLDAHTYLAQLDILAGDLSAALARCDQVLAHTPPQLSPLATILLPRGMALYQRNALDAAAVALHDAHALAHRGHISDVLWAAHVALADVHLARGDVAAAAADLAQAHAIARPYHSPMLTSYLGAAQARFDLRTGNPAAAATWADAWTAAHPPPHAYHLDFEQLTVARIRLAQGDAPRARAQVAQILADAQRSGRLGSVLAAQAIAALAHQAAGDTHAAQAALTAALRLAQPQGVVRVFLDLGPALHPLLHRAAAEHRDHPTPWADFAAALLAQTPDAAAPAPPLSALPAALSDQERTVLRLICAGCSNREIAETLVITPGTAKWHVHNILHKLGVRSRSQAIRCAQELGLT